ncbi:MAG: hypothetical protein Q9220_003314 [cf. Caloplaca sp. 1 TL-2023]
MGLLEGTDNTKPDSKIVSTVTTATLMPNWPFFLPKARPLYLNLCCALSEDDTTLDHLGGCHDFDIDALAWAIQNGLSPSCISRYIDRWDIPKIEQGLRQPVNKYTIAQTYPILFYAVERNSPELIRLLCHRGVDPNGPGEPENLPILAYAIISAEYSLSDTTDCLFTLLAMGADPYQLPRDMWCEYVRAPTKTVLKASEEDVIKYRWLTVDARAALCRTFNLLQRYHFKMASMLPRKTPRQKQVAAAFDLTPLFEIPFQIVGQRLAARTVQEWVTSHALHHIEMPLVLLFTGPSGHGKTELAKSMGELLSVPFLKIDCTQMQKETDLFGANAPYQGWQDGSTLNNYLAEHSGQKAVVFLDEFDKTTEGVYKSLLLVFDEGFYRDRRSKGKQLNCTKIIWVLASNQGDTLIRKFWEEHLAAKPEISQLAIRLDPLHAQLEQSFKGSLGAPLVGRLSAIIPFLPFSQEERAVTTYKFMRKLFNKTRKNIDVEAKQLAGHTFLNFVDDGQLATFIADRYYSPELGARSLQKAVNTQICHKLTKAILEQAEVVSDEMNKKPWDCYDVRVEDLKGGFKDITVRANGVRSVQKRIDPPKCSSLI